MDENLKDQPDSAAPPVAEATPINPNDCWAVLEIMGHERLAGHISEKPIGNTIFLVVQVPATSKLPAFTRLLHPNSLFSLTPVPEAAAQVVAESLQKTAVNIDYRLSIAERQQLRPLLGIPAPAAPVTPEQSEDSHAGGQEEYGPSDPF